MEVNITVFVQMINFIIAWILLRIFYFSPAVHALDIEQREHERVMDKKHKWQNYVSTKQQEIESRWHMLKRFSKQHMPDIHHQDFFIFKDVADTIEMPHIDKKKMASLSHEIADAIISGVDHVEQ